MAHRFELPKVLADAGWVLKIRDRERVEPPHVTVMHRTRAWRFGLREGAFLDGAPPPREVPAALRKELARRRTEFAGVWDQLYPENPVDSQDGRDGSA
jgi:hypothetical protein